MALVYSDTEVRTGSVVPYDRINANKGYLNHYTNYCYLKFLYMRGTTQEKFQAGKELVICERKMDWHQRHPNFAWEDVLPERQKIMAQWSESLTFSKDGKVQ